MKKVTIYALAILGLSSCGGESTEGTDKDTTSGDTVALMQLEFCEPYDMPEACVVTGEIFDVHTWNDANGKNFIIRTSVLPTEDTSGVSETGMPAMTSSVYVYHYTETKSKEVKKLGQAEAHVKMCEFDILYAHIGTMPMLTDINGDGFGELTTMFRYTCTSDVSPSDQRLVLFENGKQYMLQGTSEVLGTGGTYSDSSQFMSAPAGYFDHAKLYWDGNKAEEF